MGEEKDIGWGACFVSNRFRHGNGNCVELCKNAQAWKLMKVLVDRMQVLTFLSITLY